tara:strand:+ start:1063 stop:1962 length:900 start_codon:yes stop_codon:yes gene_type:complete
MSAYQDFDHIPTLSEVASELVFEPRREALCHDGRIVKDKFAIINPSVWYRNRDKQGEVMQVVGKSHVATPYSVMWNSMREGIEMSGLDTSQVQIKFLTSPDGGSYAADIIFKQYEFTPVVGDVHSMRFRVYDSHDMTFKHHIQCGLFRYYCDNGQSALAEKLEVKAKHTLTADPEKLGRIVADFPAKLEAEAELYKNMMNTPVSKDRAVDFLRANIATYRVASGIKVNEKAVEECARVWNMYQNLGDTGYRLFNVITHVGTHVTGRDGTNMARKQARLEQKAQSVVDLPEFKQLVGLAA